MRFYSETPEATKETCPKFWPIRLTPTRACRNSWRRSPLACAFQVPDPFPGDSMEARTPKRKTWFHLQWRLGGASGCMSEGAKRNGTLLSFNVEQGKLLQQVEKREASHSRFVSYGSRRSEGSHGSCWFSVCNSGNHLETIVGEYIILGSLNGALKSDATCFPGCHFI